MDTLNHEVVLGFFHTLPLLISVKQRALGSKHTSSLLVDFSPYILIKISLLVIFLRVSARLSATTRQRRIVR